MGKLRPLGDRGENKGLNLSLLLLLTTTATFGAGPELLLTGSLRRGVCGRRCLSEDISACVRGRASPTMHDITPFVLELELLLLVTLEGGLRDCRWQLSAF